MLGVRHQIAVILDTAHYVLDINISILPEYTDSELVTCLFFKDSFIYGRVCSTKKPFSGLSNLNKISLKNQLIKRCNCKVCEKRWEESALLQPCLEGTV